MSADERPDRIGTEITHPEPDLLDLKRKQAEIEAIQAQMMQWRARMELRIDDRRATIDLGPADVTTAELDANPPAAE